MGLGSQHGFRVSWTPVDAAGSSEVFTRSRYSRVDGCVTAMNVGWGQDTTLGCQTLWSAWP